MNAKTPSPSVLTSARRSFIPTSFVVALSASLVSAAGCSTQPHSFGSDLASGGSIPATGASTGVGASGGVLGGGGANGSGASSTGGSLSTGGALTGGASSGGGASGSANGGSGGGSGGSGGSGTGGEPCVDLEPPYDATWPDATCEKWANESPSCSEAWFASYCDVSCGRCVPAGGTGGSGGGTMVEPCVDLEPPYDPEWPGATCLEWSSESTACGEAWFSDYCDVSCGRCVPEGGGTGGSAGVDCSAAGLPNVSGGDGYATRYWDCCQTHCAQFDGHRCGRDGVSGTGDTNSACNGGGSFACYDEAPHAVSDCLSYGYIAKANPNCGGCYRIQFTGTGHDNANDAGSKLIKGKQMIVKVSNTGSDVGGNQFDLMVPGGGVGQFNACANQWGTSDLGAQYGGFLTNCSGSHAAKKDCVRQECMKIPAGSARDGCLWFVDWFEVADNPNFTSQQTDCPF